MNFWQFTLINVSVIRQKLAGIAICGYVRGMSIIPPPADPADYLNTSKRACPKCGLALDRVRRRPVDRLTSLFSPVQRFHCRSFTCRWEGNLKAEQHAAGASSLL